MMMHRRGLLGGVSLAAVALLGLRPSNAVAADASSIRLAQHADAPPPTNGDPKSPPGKNAGGTPGMAPKDDDDDDDDDDDKEPSPEEKMQRRFPQPVKVGFLVGLPLLDWNDSTIGFITDVVRTPEGKNQLVVPVGGWFGRGGRPVAVPIETVAILARQVDLLDLTRDDLAKLPTFDGKGTSPIDRGETIRIAITRR